MQTIILRDIEAPLSISEPHSSAEKQAQEEAGSKTWEKELHN